MQTNLAGFPCRIEFVNTRMLSVQLTNKPPAMRLSLVSVVDENGQSLDDFTGSWSQHGFAKMLKLNNPTKLHLTVAIRPEHEIEFTLQPRREK